MTWEDSGAVYGVLKDSEKKSFGLLGRSGQRKITTIILNSDF